MEWNLSYSNAMGDLIPPNYSGFTDGANGGWLPQNGTSWSPLWSPTITIDAPNVTTDPVMMPNVLEPFRIYPVDHIDIILQPLPKKDPKTGKFYRKIEMEKE